MAAHHKIRGVCIHYDSSCGPEGQRLTRIDALGGPKPDSQLAALSEEGARKTDNKYIVSVYVARRTINITNSILLGSPSTSKDSRAGSLQQRKRSTNIWKTSNTP